MSESAADPAFDTGTAWARAVVSLHPPRSMRKVALAIALVYLLLAGLIVAGTGVLVARDRAQELHRAEGELSSLARVLEEHVERSLGQVDSVMAAAATQIGAGGGLPAVGERSSYNLTRAWLSQTPQVLGVLTGKGDGTLFSDSRNFPVRPLALADAAALAQLRDDPASRMRVFSPRRDAASAQWVIPVARRIERSDGRFDGFVWALVSPAYFEQFYRDVRLNGDDAVGIFTRAGVPVLRVPFSDDAAGLLSWASPQFGPPELHTTQISPDVFGHDAKRAIVASRMLESYPLVVQICRPRDTALRPFYANTKRLVSGVALLLGLLGLLAWVVFVDVRRREIARRTLQTLADTLEERVRQRTAELETSNRELLAFSYSVSHDLRAPLRAINGFSHALLEDYGAQFDAVGRDYLERIARASVRMGELIDELLKLANVARQPLEIRSVDVSTMAQDVIEDLRATTPQRQPAVNIQPGMVAEADETLLRNVLGNLLDNAWKFTRERGDSGSIRVEATAEETVVQFRVCDNGVGFDMVYAGRLFQPFQQLHGGQQYKGTGIGLASARRIVERHGGKIWADASVGQGTTIYFTLPRQAAVIRKRRPAV